MLKLFVIAVRYALPLFVPVAIVLASRAHAPMERRTVTRITWGVCLAVGVTAAFLAWLRLNTNRIDVPTLNFILVPLMLLGALCYLGITWWFGSRDLHAFQQSRAHRALLVISLINGALVILVFGFEYFFSTDAIVLMGSSLLETESLLRLAGFTAGSLLVIVAAWAYVKTTRLVPAQIRSFITTCVFITVIGPRAILLYQQFAGRGYLPRSSTVFELVLWIQESNAIILLTLAILIAIPGFIAVRYGQAPQDVNPAQARLAQAERISRRRFLGLAVLVSATFTTTLTIGKSQSEKVPELSPIEPSTVTGDVVSVNRELVSDGHLHRFAYLTSDGTEVRFIVIKKNQSSYGCGLDACEICGESGYYEDKGKVICRRCDVMMNIQTIGFPGGCNPIPIHHEVTPDELRFSASELSSHARIFQTRAL